jgi:hypothetical protein
MPRLALGRMEEALIAPAEFRAALDSQNERRFGETYRSALRHAVIRYHGNGDGVAAVEYLRNRFENSSRLRNADRILDTIDQLEWYVSQHTTQHWLTAQSPLRIVVPMPSNTVDLTCSGELLRLDLNPAGGYVGWTLFADAPQTWSTELRFPLIQSSLAASLGVSPDEIGVGIIDSVNHSVERISYGALDLRRAKRRFARLVSALGY